MRWLLRGLLADLRVKFRSRPMPVPFPSGDASRGFRAFDDALTAPVNGFADAADYYRRATTVHRLTEIAVPTWVLLAADDPFLPLAPGERIASAPPVAVSVLPHGGHVGFMNPRWPWRRAPWLDSSIVAALASEPGRLHD